MTNPPSLVVWRPSELVGLNVRRLRERRDWSQQKLVDRLNELLTDTPQWAVDLYEARQKDPSRSVDSRERRPRAHGTEPSSWNQPKVARLERGKLRRVSIEEVFELALALDVSPLTLIADGENPDGAPLRIRLSPTLARWPRDVRHWIRGAKPLLDRLAYRNDVDAVTGYRFYLSTQPLGELRKAADEADELRRAWRPVEELLAPTDEEHVE